MQFGGTASGTIFESQGVEVVASSGTAIGTTVNGATPINTMAEHSWCSGPPAALFLNSGGEQIISSGGIASGTVANAFGMQEVSAGGIAIGFIAHSTGGQDVQSGGTASATTLSGQFATEFVFSGGRNVGARAWACGRRSVLAAPPARDDNSGRGRLVGGLTSAR